MIGSWQPDFMRGYRQKDEGRLDDAILSFQRSIAQDRAQSVVWSNYGEALMRVGRPQEAAGALSEALRLDPNELPAICNLGSVYRNAGDYQNAEKCWIRALQLDPNSYPVLFNLATVYMMVNMPDHALPLYRKLAVLKPEDTDIHTGYVNSALAVDPDEAKLERKRWRVLHRAWNDQANENEAQKRWREAEKYLWGGVDASMGCIRDRSRSAPNGDWEAYEAGYAAGWANRLEKLIPGHYVHEPIRVIYE